MSAAMPSPTPPPSRLPAKLCLAGLVLVPVLSGVAILAVQGSLTGPGAEYLPWAVAGLVVVYAVAGLWLLRRPSEADAAAAWLGLLAGTMWSVEIFAGGPARLEHAQEQAIGATFAIAAAVATLSAGPLVYSRSGRSHPTVRAGALAGVVSGIVVFVFATAMTLLALRTLGARSDYQQQFRTSGAPSMNAFLVQDILTAASAHLVINLMLGLAGAAIAIIVTQAQATMRKISA